MPKNALRKVKWTLVFDAALKDLVAKVLLPKCEIILQAHRLACVRKHDAR
jgi:hypothetical protein